MKDRKSTIRFALFMTVLLCFSILSSCAGDAGTEPSNTPTPSSGASVSSSSPETESPLEAGVVRLPIVEDTANFTIWAGYQAQNITDYNQAEAYIELEKRTNVHIDWLMTSSADAATNFNLIIASQQYPDSFQGSLNYFNTQGLDFYMDEGIITDITDLAEKYCPNYMLESTKEDVAKGCITDTGRRPGFFGIKRTWQPSFLGPVTRGDWLKELGLKAPETLSQLHDTLVAFKDNYSSCIAPTVFSNTGIEQLFLQAWGINGTFFLDGDKVQYGPLQDEFRDYLAMMNQWWDEGLIDPDFYSTPFRAFDNEYILNGKLGYWYTNATSIDGNVAAARSSGDSDFEIIPVHCPAMNEGDTRIATLNTWISPNRFQNTIGTINTTCKDPVTLAKWYDYLFTWEGCVLVSYGPGRCFYFDEDGVPRCNEIIYNNPDGYSPLTALYMYAMNGDMPSLYDWERENFVTMSDTAKSANAIWDYNYKDRTALPTNLSISVEESARYSAIMSDVETYLNETVVKFVIGEISIDKFEEFRKNIENLNISEAIAIKQAAVDRYNNR